MRNLLIAGAAAISLAALPATGSAQMQGNMAQPETYPMNMQQQQMYDTWDADTRMTYQRMTIPMQEYYWSLNADQQSAWWMLDDNQRMRLYDMEPTQRTAAWTSIMQQVAAASTGNAGMMQNNTPMNTSAMNNNMAMNNSMTSGNIRFVSTTMVQPTPRDAGPPTGDLPLCEPQSQDNCINPWEAGKRGAGVPKPLDYYPGPAGPNPRR